MPVFRSVRVATSVVSPLGNVGRVLALLAMLGAALLPAPGVLAQTPPAPAAYVVHELPTLGGDAGSVVEVNDAGMAVGWSELRPGEDEAHATLWVNGEAIDLGTLGGDDSLAIDINAAGVIVGYAENAAGERHAVIWRDGVIADLGTLGGENSSANAVNESGVVVGRAQTASGDVHAVQWSDGEMRDLGTLGGAASEAMDIADNGVVYGTADTPDGSPQAVMWSGSLASALGTLGGDAAYAMAVNPSGLLVGFASDPDGVQRALVWRDGVRTPHRLDPDDPTATLAVAINDRGDISGSIASATPQMRAVIWRDGKRTQLPGFVDDMSGSYSITNAGVVGGYAANASGQHRPVLWVPTSVPTPAALVGASVSLAEVGDDAAVSNQFTVESHDIFFQPTELDVPSDTEVTILLPNEGAAPHNFSIDALDISVDIAPGETKEVTFTAPEGEYEYYCNVPGHREAGMVGTLVVRSEIAATPAPSPIPAPMATPVATPVAALPCRDVMENDFPGQRRTLRADCTTDRPLFVPEAWVFDGGGHTIYARDPDGGRLSGGVVTVSGDGSTVRNVTVDGSQLTAPCLVDHGATSLAGVLVQGSGGEVTGVTVRNLSQALPAGSAADMGVLASCGAGITVEGPTAEAFVVENTIENAGVAGILINEGTASISHNTIDRVAETGILAVNGANVRVSPGNRVTNGQVGIQLEDSGTGGRIAGNTIESMSRAGIAVILDARATVADNTVEDAFYGIFASSGAATNMNGNTIRRAQDSGIFVSNTGTRATIKDNTIDSSLSDGIWVQEGAQASVLGNTVTGSARYGIAAIGAGTRVTIDDNTVADSGLNGVWAGIGSVAEISGNAVNDAAEDGILATGSAEASIRENRVAGGQRGIEIAGAGTTATVVNNAVERVGVVGITINQGAAAPDVSGNTVSEARFGIVTLGAGTTSTVANNTVSELSASGFTVEDGAAAMLRGNHVSDASWGVIVTGAVATADLSENRVERMTNGGISVNDGAQATVAGNTLLQPGTNGIDIEDAGLVHLEGNTIEDARGDGIRLERVRPTTVNGDAVELVSHDIYYEPTAITIPAGTDVTLILPNEGAAPHNVTIDALGVDVDIAPGETEEVIINAPAGTYEISCGVPGHREAGQVAELLVAPGIRPVAVAEPVEADVIRDNEISGGENGVVVTGAGVTATLMENSIAAPSGAGIAVANGATVTVDNNAVTEAGLGIDIVGIGTTASLSGNRVSDTVERGIQIQTGAEATLHENVVMRAGTTGIWIDGQGTAATLTGNIVSNAAAEGIKVERAATATITDGNVVSGGKWGIAILSDGTTAEVRGNRVRDASYQGVSIVHGAYAVIVGNTVHGDSGFYVRHPRSRAVITGNSVTAERQGIYVWEGAAAERIADNVVSGGSSGVVIAGDGVHAVVEDNSVSGFEREGIAVRDGASADVTGNRVQRNRLGLDAWGIIVAGPGTAATIAGNEISDIDGIGIQVSQSATGTVRDNLVRAVANTGIRVMDAAHDVLVSENTLQEAGTVGIEARLSDAAIRDNTVEGATFAGIQFGVGAEVEVTSNTIVGPAEPNADDSGPYGVHIQRDAHGTVSGNRISEVVNQASGTGCAISIDANAPDVRVADNMFPPPGNDQDVCDERIAEPGATPAPAATPVAATPLPDGLPVPSSTDREGV